MQRNIFQQGRFSLLVIMAVLCIQSANAAEFEQHASITTGVAADTNPEMRDQNEESITKFILQPRYESSWQSETSSFSTTASLNGEYSSNTDVYDHRADPTLSAGWVQRVERGEYRLSGSFLQQSTRFSEIDDTGLLFDDGTRRVGSLGGGLTRRVSERSELDLSAGYRVSEYSDTRFQDFKLADIGLGINRIQSQQQTVFLSFNARSFRPEENQASSVPAISNEIYTVSAGVQREISAVFSLNAMVGYSETEVAIEGQSTVWSLGLDYSGERLSGNVNLGQSVNGSGVGGVTESTTVGGSLIWQGSEVTRYGASVGFRKNDSLLGNESSRTELWAERSISEDFSVRISWMWRQQANQFVSHSHILLASLSYNFF